MELPEKKTEGGGKHWTGKMGRKLIWRVPWALGLDGGHHPVAKGVSYFMQSQPWTASIFSSSILWIQGTLNVTNRQGGE